MFIISMICKEGVGFIYSTITSDILVTGKRQAFNMNGFQTPRLFAPPRAERGSVSHTAYHKNSWLAGRSVFMTLPGTQGHGASPPAGYKVEANTNTSLGHLRWFLMAMGTDLIIEAIICNVLMLKLNKTTCK